MAHHLDAHNKERGVFINTWYGTKGFSFSVDFAGDRPRVGKQNPDGVEGNGEEVSE